MAGLLDRRLGADAWDKEPLVLTYDDEEEAVEEEEWDEEGVAEDGCAETTAGSRIFDPRTFIP